MAHYSIRITPTPGFGFTGGPEFSTDIKNAQNGRERRNGDWANCRHRYTCPFNNITNEAYLNVKEVFLVVRGRLHTFLHRDWADYQVSAEKFGEGDGLATQFQLRKVSSLGAASYERVITKPADGVVILVNGVPTTATVDPLTGIVTFSSAPADGAVLRWTGEFDVQVRFDNDYLPFSLDNRSGDTYISNGSIDLIEVVDE